MAKKIENVSIDVAENGFIVTLMPHDINEKYTKRIFNSISELSDFLYSELGSITKERKGKEKTVVSDTSRIDTFEGED
ncbi:MAG TPA: hypothetical protein PKY23_10950 [Bacillota bacterium]|nr:hypothetical protein [Bacillota bacterium]